LIRRKLFLALLSLLVAWFFVFGSLGQGIAWGVGEKKDCSTLSGEELKEILRKLNATDAKVLNIADSPLKGYCEVAIDHRGRIVVFYLDLDNKYLIFGNLVEIATMSNKTVEAERKIEDKRRIDVSKVPLANALVLGTEGAAKKVVVFTDPDCPYCAQLHKTMKEIVVKRKDIAFYIKFLPLEMHKDAYWKARSIVCSRSIQMLEDNFDHKEISKKDCATDEIEKSVRLAQSLGIGGTPSLILPDGRLKVGALAEGELLDLIDGKK